MMPGPVSEPPSVPLSCEPEVEGAAAQRSLTSIVSNNFWGKDDAGVSPLLERMHNAKVTGDELKAFYTSARSKRNSV